MSRDVVVVVFAVVECYDLDAVDWCGFVVWDLCVGVLGGVGPC